MNRIYKNMNWALIGLSALTLGSCSDFLTENPQSLYTVETIYKTQSDFEYAISSVYAAQQDAYDGQYGLFRLANARADDTNCYNTNTYTTAAQFLDNASDQAIETGWQKLYVVISRCNGILTRIDGVEMQDKALKQYIKGEAYALRAWAYQNLAAMFGGVPLIVDREYTVAETRQIGRATQAETYAQAEKDYLNAMELLPEVWETGKYGRVTKYAAAAGLGRLYMMTKQYAKAQNVLNTVIKSGKYDMAANYVDCFSEAGEGNKERVWEVQFITGLKGEGQTFSESCMPESYTGDAVLGTWAYSGGSSAALQTSTNLLKAYEQGDKRKDVTTVYGVTARGSVDEHNYFKKFNYPTNIPKSGTDWGVNLPIIRYTDVLMMYAEAVNEVQGPVAEAVDIVDRVRARAGLPPVTAAGKASKEAFRTTLQKERRIEFAFEGLRWNDLVRWDIADVVMNEFFKDADEGNGKYSCEKFRYIYAIPLEEITRYGDQTKMWQNPGY